jgi:hypothetical protein
VTFPSNNAHQTAIKTLIAHLVVSVILLTLPQVLLTSTGFVNNAIGMMQMFVVQMPHAIIIPAAAFSQIPPTLQQNVMVDANLIRHAIKSIINV